jgi:8-oxo-dGTP pyrophosphatase MutT (NUDIX family)
VLPPESAKQLADSGASLPPPSVPKQTATRPFADPRTLALLPAVEGEAYVDALAWTEARLKQVFQSPPVWAPELTGDSVRINDRAVTPAAVLVPLVHSPQGWRLLLTLRSSTLQDHAGQIAFPGGRVDPDDAHAEFTATREAFEEIGLNPSAVEVIGRLPNYRTGTGYDITPVVALVESEQDYVPQPSEVEAIFEVPLQFLMDPANHQRRAYALNGAERFFYAMPYVDNQREFFIWGATAAIIRNFYRLLSHAG